MVFFFNTNPLYPFLGTPLCNGRAPREFGGGGGGGEAAAEGRRRLQQ